MAEIALTFIAPLIESAISKAVSFAREQVSLAWGLKTDLEDLAHSLDFIQQVLEDAERKQEIDRSVRSWLARLKDVAYEAADVLDEYGYELLSLKVKSRGCNQVHTFSCLSKPTSFSLNNIARNINKINESLNKIKSDASLLVQLVRSSSSNQSHHAKTNSIFDCSKFVGRSSDVSDMVELLANMGSSSQQPLSGISIVGFGGIGKTTLAKSICERVKSQSSYDVVAWVCVSEYFDAEKILKELLEYFEVGASSMANFSAAFSKLQAELEKKKILLVLDDVWEESLEKWNYLSSLLSEALKTTGNSIVVTTRINKVACMAMERFPMHKHDVSKLSDEDCWLIIEDMVLRSSAEASVPSDLEAIGRDIARRCGGLPLVANVIGGTLSREMTSENWRKIRDDEAWILKDENNKKIVSILKLSFDRLPSPLKRCFSYCAIFPKDYVIEKDDLIHLWMAQEYLQPSKESSISMEDVGDMYFNDLLSNSLFQDITMDAFGNVKSCKMHDLVHDLALFVSKGEILIWDGCCNIADSLNVRHLRVKFDGESSPTIPRDIAQRLHSLFFEGDDVFCSSGSDLKSLRSLKLMRYNGEKLPLGKLKHLRYLDVLGATLIRSIFISKPYNLQTLNLSYCEQMKRFSNGMINLVNLRHIRFTEESHMPRIISHLQFISLQSLSMFVVDKREGQRLKELVGLSQLGGELAIRRLERAKPTSTTLEDRKKLYNLTFHWSFKGGNIKNDEKVFESLRPHPDLKRLRVVNYKGSNWPSWMSGSSVNGSVSLFALQNMVELELFGCKCTHIPNLGLLSTLKNLTIGGMREVKSMGHKFYTQRSNSEIGAAQESIAVLYPALIRLHIFYMDMLEEWVEVVENAAAGLESGEDAPAERNCVIVFPCLKELQILDCPKLKTWSMGGFCSDHKLVSLEIVDCPSLMAMPRINGLPSLKTLDLRSCGQLRSLPIDLESCIPLQKVVISGCQNLKSIGEHFGETSSGVSFPNLEYCTTGGFSPDLEEFPFPLPGLVSIHGLSLSLQSLTLYGWDRVKSLPHQLQHLTALKSLEIWDFDGVEDLPEWLRNLSSLQTLKIVGCIKLMHLPSIEAMRCLSNLDYIYISGSPKLKENCKEGGPEWLKIPHISHRNI